MLDLSAANENVLHAIIDACVETPFAFGVCDRSGRIVLSSNEFQDALSKDPGLRDYERLLGAALRRAMESDDQREVTVAFGEHARIVVAPSGARPDYGIVVLRPHALDQSGAQMRHAGADRSFLNAALRRYERFGLLLCNFDRFRFVNETFGHEIGDLLLHTAVQRIARQLSGPDILVRTGTEEFAIIVPGEQPDALAHASRLADDLIEIIGRPFMIREHVVQVGLSVGIAVRDEGQNPQETLRHANLALEEAMRSGRGQTRRFTSLLDERAHARHLIERDLIRALTVGEFEVHYQPKVVLPERKLVGCEALLRWRHPERGMISPSTFIPIAEETGIIVNIGKWAMSEICGQAAKWPPHCGVAINLSPVQIRQPDLVSRLSSILSISGLDPHRLEVEITEGVLLENTAATLSKLRALKELGLRIAIDDFGTGFSSLSYLKAFPFDTVKIDQGFVRDMQRGAEAAAIVRAVIGIGRDLGLAVVAEGVESEEQLLSLAQKGCSQVQGYLVGKPVPAATFEKLWL